jgi:hypothetical protein
LLNNLGIIDPDCLHHTSHTDQQIISFILCWFSDVDPYTRIKLEYYTKMEFEVCFNIEKYVDHLTRQHIDSQSVNLHPLRSYQVDTVQAHYAGQDRYAGTSKFQPSGYQNFLFVTKAEFFHMKANHPELNDRLCDLRLEVAEELVPVRGPLPPNLARAASNLKCEKPRPGIVVQREVTALNSYIAEDNDCEDGDQWEVSGCDTVDQFTDYDQDTNNDDRWINSIRTVRLPTLRILHMHRTSDFVSVIDGGADTMVLGTGWRLIEEFSHRKVNIVGFDESDARKYGCTIGTAVSVMKDVTGTEY